MPVFKRTPTMGVSVRLAKQETPTIEVTETQPCNMGVSVRRVPQENAATPAIPDAPEYDPTVRPVDPFSNVLLNQHDSGLRIRMHRVPELAEEREVVPKAGKLWVQKDHTDAPRGAIWHLTDEVTRPAEGPAQPKRRDVQWWSAFITGTHPSQINSGQEYINYRCLENLSCFSRKDPCTGEVYAGILDHWVAYSDAGEKVYIQHPFKEYALHELWPPDMVSADRSVTAPIPRPPLRFSATTDLALVGSSYELPKYELCGVLATDAKLGTTYPDPESFTTERRFTDGFQIFDISDDGRRCLIGWYTESFFMSYGARPVQELWGMVELFFDFEIARGQVSRFSVTAVHHRFVDGLEDQQLYTEGGKLKPYRIWAHSVSEGYYANQHSDYIAGPPLGGFDIGIEVPRQGYFTDRWDQYIQYLGSFYHEGEIRDIIMYNYYQNGGGSTSGDLHFSITLIDYGGLYQVFEEFEGVMGPGTDSLAGVETEVNTVVGHLLNPRVYGDRSDTYLNAWGWTWDAFSIIYGDDWWAETFFDIHGSCRCCSVVMYEGLWWDDDSWNTIGSGSPQRANRSAFLTPNGLVGEKSWMDAGHAAYSAPTADAGNGDHYAYWLFYHMLPDKAAWNPATGQVAGPSCLPLAWLGEWSENWKETPNIRQGIHFFMEAIPVVLDCDHNFWLGTETTEWLLPTVYYG